MAKKGGRAGRAARKAKAYLKRRTPRGGRMSIMFKTAIAVTGAALVGGAALNMVNTAKGKPTEGLTAGVVSGGAGLLLAFTLGLFKGTRQYVTPVLAGAAAVGALNAFSGPISRGSANIAKALLGEGGAGGGLAGERSEGGKGAPKGLPPMQQLPKAKKASKGEQALGIATSLAQIGASIAQNIQAGRSGTSGLSAGQQAVAAAAGLSDVDVPGAGEDADGSGYDDEMDGSEGMDDFAIIGSSIMGDSDDE